MDWGFIQKNWRYGIEILILTIGIYQIYRAFKKTRGARILVGLVVILVMLTGLLLGNCFFRGRLMEPRRPGMVGVAGEEGVAFIRAFDDSAHL